MSSTAKKKTALAEITAAFGWNFVLQENYALGLMYALQLQQEIGHRATGGLTCSETVITGN